MSEERAVPHVEMRGIVKRFGDFTALDGVDLVVGEHEIHALLGENGAGKSTLMNILYGLYRPDAGRIRLRGQEAHIRSPRDAIAQGIGMIHQHFMLIPPLTVAENVVLGVLIGACIMGVIKNGLVIMKVSSYWHTAIIGVVIVLAAVLDRARRRD